MRLLHTSDWHLGRSFHGASLLEEQEAAIARIAELAREHAVDAVLIAGDLYDRAIPPAEAVELFNRALAQLSRDGTAVVAIAGNHDSHVRVSVYDPLLSAFGVTVRGDVGRAQEPVLVTPRDGGEPVAIYPLPYLEPAVVGPALAGEPVRLRHEEVTRLAIARIHADRRERPPQRSVLVAHTFVAGGETSESERQLTIGNVDRVSVAAFEGFDYVALGHLHGSQQLDGPRVAYSGTPLAYSFSEQQHVKSVRIVELAADGTPSVQVVPLGVGRRLCTLRGPIDELCSDPAHDAASEARVRAILTDDTLPLQAMARLRARFPHIAELRHEPPELARAGGAERHRQVRQVRSPLELATAFFADQQGRSPGEPEAELLRAALAAAERGGER
ncbi:MULTISPECIES: exonuclease SbcCD subunit D [unclassified Cyanobium]|uniref:exonuclease SbcCD subunit D n=1 Tax=unclassified Cyanobium TaxID=2627006 RepID=UPI0020CDAA7C|nr:MULTISPECIES: exonuclease SbcCD subunit D [unclassified Cyanobium]MCP9834173.1 exonuclease SbcCD subunit D [Cyanobium sp. La Preciosa 7G6]MCP9936936.1 exonuclease SbcCD subunit D [Cyanobium sp. Aljojuca 7A6]